MPFMNWNDQLSVNVEALDADHKQLIEIINELYDSMLNSPSRDLLNGIFDRLVDYTKNHFAREEKFFDATNYPDTGRHKQKHAEMTAWVLDTQRKYRFGELPAPSMQVAMYLKQWLLTHIVGADNEYKEFFREHGIH
jgi:hemerythrin-like metal-binding protein